ncbi:MAG: DUF4124 domain-containing protein [Comamonas sp.]
MPRPHAATTVLTTSCRITACAMAGLLGTVLWLGAGDSAQAQVTRCTDPISGKVTYTDGECSRGAAVTEIERRKSEEELAQERARTEQALRAKAERREQALEQRKLEADERAAQAALQPKRPARVDYASSASCQQSRERYSAASEAATDKTMGSRAQLDAAKRQMEIDCLGPEAYARLEASRPSAPPVVVTDDYWGRPPYGHPRPPVRPHPRPPQPAPNIVHCDVFKCRDAQGYTHPRGPLGETVRRP